MRRVSLFILGLSVECTYLRRQTLVDRVMGNTKWIQRGTVLADR